jgi:hypothetical protein
VERAGTHSIRDSQASVSRRSASLQTDRSSMPARGAASSTTRRVGNTPRIVDDVRRASNEPPPSLEPRCHNWGVTAPTQCAAKLRDGRTCRSVTHSRRPLGIPHATRSRTRAGYGLERRACEETKRPRANSRRRGIRAARDPITCLRSPIRGPTRPRRYRRGGSRDDPSRSARGCDEHEPAVVGDVHLS